MSLEAFEQAVAQGHALHGFTVVTTGFLSNGIDGTVVVDQANRLVYWHQNATTGERGPFISPLWKDANLSLKNIEPGTVIEIELGFPPNSDTFSVLGQTEVSTSNMGGFTQKEQQINAAQFPQATTIQDLRVIPLAGHIEAKVLLGHYTRPSTGVPYKFERDTRDAAGGNKLSSLQVALASGQHRIAWLFLDKETDELRVVAGAAKAALDTLPAKAEFLDAEYQAIGRPNAACKRLTPVYLYYGQTELAASDIIYEWDMRFDTPIESRDASSAGALLSATGNRLLSATGNILKAA